MDIKETSAEDAISTYPSSDNSYHWLGVTAINPVRSTDSDLEKVLISYPSRVKKSKKLKHIKHISDFI